MSVAKWLHLDRILHGRHRVPRARGKDKTEPNGSNQEMSTTAPKPEKPVGTDVAIYDRVTNIPDFIAQYGDAIYRSGMFGCAAGE